MREPSEAVPLGFLNLGLEFFDVFARGHQIIDGELLPQVVDEYGCRFLRDLPNGGFAFSLYTRHVPSKNTPTIPMLWVSIGGASGLST